MFINFFLAGQLGSLQNNRENETKLHNNTLGSKKLEKPPQKINSKKDQIILSDTEVRKKDTSYKNCFDKLKDRLWHNFNLYDIAKKK